MQIATASLRSLAESILKDSCIVQRDPEGITDDVLDTTTGQLTRPPGEPTTVFSGACQVRFSAYLTRTQGGEAVDKGRYVVRLPISADVVLNDRITITSCVDDPTVQSQVLRVADITKGTLAMTRACTCEAVESKGVR